MVTTFRELCLSWKCPFQQNASKIASLEFQVPLGAECLWMSTQNYSPVSPLDLWGGGKELQLLSLWVSRGDNHPVESSTSNTVCPSFCLEPFPFSAAGDGSDLEFIIGREEHSQPSVIASDLATVVQWKSLHVASSGSDAFWPIVLLPVQNRKCFTVP